VEMRGWVAEVRESGYQHRKGKLLSSLLCLSAGFALCGHSTLVAGFQRKGASGSAGELTTPGICKTALQGNHQEPGLSMVLAAANFMGFWDYKWDKPTCPCCLTVGGHDALRLTQVTFDDKQRLQLHLLGFRGDD
jgi:hypothetical protein